MTDSNLQIGGALDDGQFESPNPGTRILRMPAMRGRRVGVCCQNEIALILSSFDQICNRRGRLKVN